jgi:hypothetical protein
MAEFVAGIIDRIRTVSLHQWLARLVLALAGTALIVACSVSTDATLNGVLPSVTGVLLATLVIWPESIGTIAFLALTMLWWLLAWHGSIWATVAMAALVSLVHILSAVVGGPPHSVIRRAVVRLLSARIALYVLVTAAVGALVVALTAVPSARFVAWLAVVVVTVATLVATLVAGMTDEAGQPDDELLDDEPYVREDLADH